jgi:hypothetical protein
MGRDVRAYDTRAGNICMSGNALSMLLGISGKATIRVAQQGHSGGRGREINTLKA